MPSTEVTFLGRLPSGQHSSTGNCWLTESGTCQLWDLQELEWLFFTWKFLLAYFASLYGCIWETWVMSAPAVLWTHPGAFRFMLNKDCIAGFSASSQVDLLEMLVCIIVGMSLFVLLLTSVKEQFYPVNALGEAPKLGFPHLGLSQLWAQLGLSDDLLRIWQKCLHDRIL